MESQDNRLIFAIAASVLIHVPVVYVITMAVISGASRQEAMTYFEVMPVDQPSEPLEPTPEEEEEDDQYEPPDDQPDGQVVDAPELGENRRPLDPRFLSTRDQIVEEESAAAVRLQGHQAASPQISSPGIQQLATQTQPSLPAPLIAGLMPQSQGLQPQPEGEQSAHQLPPSSAPTPLVLQPTTAALADAVAGTGLDNFQDVEDGAATLLSTAAWSHSLFFQRVKRSVEQYWHPDRAFRTHDPGGHVYGYRNRETIIRVVLNSQGGLERAYIISPSGADFLDHEARQAIVQGAPFANPPQGLVDPATQRIVFTFGFTVELGERPIFRLRRYGE